MSKIIKTKEAFGWIDGYLTEAKGGDPAVTIPALSISGSAAEWATFETNYGTTGSLLKALNDAWDNGGSNLTLLSDVIMPVFGEGQTTMDRGDEWFNLSYSTSVLSGFDITEAIPDDREDPMPLTYKITLAEGDCCLRIFDDPNAPIFTMHVASDVVYATGPICYVFIDPMGEVGPFINTTNTWNSTNDMTCALLYMLSIYDEAGPVVYTLESILVETVSNPVVVGSGTQCTAWGTYTNLDDPVDITNQVTWTSDYNETFHVSVNPTGEAWGESAGGSSTVTATIDAIEGTLLIECIALP